MSPCHPTRTYRCAGLDWPIAGSSARRHVILRHRRPSLVTLALLVLHGNALARIWQTAIRSSLLPADEAADRLRVSGERQYTRRDVIERCGCTAAACAGRGAPLNGARMIIMVVGVAARS